MITGIEFEDGVHDPMADLMNLLNEAGWDVEVQGTFASGTLHGRFIAPSNHVIQFKLSDDGETT